MNGPTNCFGRPIQTSIYLDGVSLETWIEEYKKLQKYKDDNESEKKQVRMERAAGTVPGTMTYQGIKIADLYASHELLKTMKDAYKKLGVV